MVFLLAFFQISFLYNVAVFNGTECFLRLQLVEEGVTEKVTIYNAIEVNGGSVMTQFTLLDIL